MHPIQATLLKLARTHMRVYVRVSQCLLDHLILSGEETLTINHDGAYTLSDGLENNHHDTAEIRGLLLALCRNNMTEYNELCELIQNTISIRMLTMVMLNESGIKKLATALNASLEPISYRDVSASNGMKTLSETHQILSESSNMPDLMDHLFSRPGVTTEKSKI